MNERGEDWWKRGEDRNNRKGSREGGRGDKRERGGIRERKRVKGERGKKADRGRE